MMDDKRRSPRSLAQAKIHWEALTRPRWTAGKDDHWNPSPFHRDIADRSGEWAVDKLAPRLPWREGSIPAIDTDGRSIDARTFLCRSAVRRAHDYASIAARRADEHAARVVRLREGYKLGDFYKSSDLNELFCGRKLPDLLGEVIGKTDLTPFDLEVVQEAHEEASALGVEPTPDALREAARGKRGAPPKVEVRTFIETLAEWWWRKTGRRPEKKRTDHIARRHRQSKTVTFVDFAEAALQDASSGGKTPLSMSNAIRRILEDMEEKGAPWK